MRREKQAKIILEYLDTVIPINWDFENYYIDAIAEGLEEIEAQKNWECNELFE